MSSEAEPQPVPADALCLVRVWIRPSAERTVLDWLDGGHIARAVSAPGMLWARRFALAEPDEAGWPAYCVLYGARSPDDLKAFFKSDLAQTLLRERDDLGVADDIKVEIAWGALEYADDA